MGGGTLGLEGMTHDDIVQMEQEFAQEDSLYQDSLTRYRDRFLPKRKQVIYAIMDRLFGCGYEDAFFDGWLARGGKARGE